MFEFNTKILVIDDMSTMRKIVQKSLMTIGFKTFVTASDGVEAWEQLTQHLDVGLIVSDWNMPNMSGIELLRKVRNDAKLTNIPFVLLTAESELSQVKEASEIGVDGYIIKPFSVVTLNEKLAQAYKRVEARLAA